ESEQHPYGFPIGHPEITPANAHCVPLLKQCSRRQRSLGKLFPIGAQSSVRYRTYGEKFPRESRISPHRRFPKCTIREAPLLVAVQRSFPAVAWPPARHCLSWQSDVIAFLFANDRLMFGRPRLLCASAQWKELCALTYRSNFFLRSHSGNDWVGKTWNRNFFYLGPAGGRVLCRLFRR